MNSSPRLCDKGRRSMSEVSVAEWVAKAEMDYESALDLARRSVKPVPDKIAYDCAQCTEKYLKVLTFVRAKLGLG